MLKKTDKKHMNMHKKEDKQDIKTTKQHKNTHKKDKQESA